MIKSSNPNKNLTNPDQIEEDRVSELSLRPTSFNDFVGQKEIQKLKVYIQAAKKGMNLLIMLCFMDHQV